MPNKCAIVGCSYRLTCWVRIWNNVSQRMHLRRSDHKRKA